MKEEIALKERLKLIEKELATLVDKVTELEEEITELNENMLEIKAIKVFLGRVYPDFKTQFPDICKKITA